MVTMSSTSLQHRAPSAADWAALAGVCVAPVLGIAAKLSVPGWIAAFMFLGSPVVLGFVGWGIAMFVRAFRPRSAVRARLGAVPVKYRVAAWGWAVSVVLPFVVVLDGGDDAPWESVLTRLFGLGPEPDWYYPIQTLGIGVGVLSVMTINILMTVWLSTSRPAMPPRPAQWPAPPRQPQ